MSHDENKHGNACDEEHMQGAEYGNKCEKCDKHYKRYTRLCPLSLGIAAGLVNALSVLVFTWMSSAAPATHAHAEVMRMISASGMWGSAFAGLILGFVSAFVLALFYNTSLCYWKRRCSRCCKCGSHCCKC